MIKEKFFKIKSAFEFARRPPLEPVLNIRIFRDGEEIDKFSSGDSPELQRRNLSRIVSIFERYKTDIVHAHDVGEIQIYIGTAKNDLYGGGKTAVEDKKNKEVKKVNG